MAFECRKERERERERDAPTIMRFWGEKKVIGIALRRTRAFFRVRVSFSFFVGENDVTGPVDIIERTI